MTSEVEPLHETKAQAERQNKPINLLAYVHLRNIHRSTGAGRVARELIEHVAQRQGINVHILADQADHAAIVDKVGHPWTGYPYHFFKRDTSRQQALWWLLDRPSAEQYWSDAQVVHCTGESYVPASKSRLLVTLHDAAYFDQGAHAKNFANLKQQMKWRLLYRTLARKADLFHTVSHFSAERLAAIFPSIRARLRVVHNAVSSRFFKPACAAGQEFMEKSNLRQRRYVLVPNGLQFRKNADLILKTWPMLHQVDPDLKLVVGGHNAPHYAAQAVSFGDSVVLTGFLDDDELCALYQGAQAVWFPSRYEGFGLPVLEAMACGAPVVASNCSSIPEVAGDAALLVDPNSIQENFETIWTILNDSHMQELLRTKGRQRASQFTWSASAARLHEVYASLL